MLVQAKWFFFLNNCSMYYLDYSWSICSGDFTFIDRMSYLARYYDILYQLLLNAVVRKTLVKLIFLLSLT